MKLAKLFWLLLFTFAVTAQAQFTYTSAGGAITITGFDCSSDNAVIPSTINGQPVTTIGIRAFNGCSSLTNVTIPQSVGLIGIYAFAGCSGLQSIIIPSFVTTFGASPFDGCTSLKAIYFRGTPPNLNTYQGLPATLGSDVQATVYYLRGRPGWGTTYVGLPTAVWEPGFVLNPCCGGIVDGQFSFTINAAIGKTVIVDASVASANPVWAPIATNTLVTASMTFSDPQWTNYPSRLYRLRAP